jgi:hypothetical protein
MACRLAVNRSSGVALVHRIGWVPQSAVHNPRARDAAQAAAGAHAGFQRHPRGAGGQRADRPVLAALVPGGLEAFTRGLAVRMRPHRITSSPIRLATRSTAPGSGARCSKSVTPRTLSRWCRAIPAACGRAMAVVRPAGRFSRAACGLSAPPGWAWLPPPPYRGRRRWRAGSPGGAASSRPGRSAGCCGCPTRQCRRPPIGGAP